MDLSVVIMAAGQGTRMKSSTPKVLHKICGKEMLFHSITEAKKLSNDISVVLFHQAERVEGAMRAYFDSVNYCLQDHEKFPGTGGAVMAPKISQKKALVLNGDMPLVMAESMQKICEIDADVGQEHIARRVGAGGRHAVRARIALFQGPVARPPAGR